LLTCAIDAGDGVLCSSSDRGECIELTTSRFCHSSNDKHLEYKHVVNVSVYSVNKLCIGFRPKSTRLCRCMCVFQFCLLLLHTCASFVFCDTFTSVFNTQHEPSQNFTFNLFLCGTRICIFHTHLSNQGNVYVPTHHLDS
jgi:hypothetical protein